MAAKTHRVLPGFGLALGYTLVYLSLLILLPEWLRFLKNIYLAVYDSTFGDPRVTSSGPGRNPVPPVSPGRKC